MKRIILEGTDAVGKTTAKEMLFRDGITCEDRSIDVISKYMLFDVDMATRAEKYCEFLKNNNVTVIFMVNHNNAEIMRRVYSRGHVSEFDKLADKYNALYYDTYLYMKERGLTKDKLLLLDCTHLSVKETVCALKEIITQNR